MINRIIDRKLTPELVPFSALGLEFTSDQINRVTDWIFSNAEPVVLDHSHISSRDKRLNSVIRKTPGILFANGEAPEDVVSVIGNIYKASCNYSAHYLGRTVMPWQTKYAAIGHLYLPGDEPTEGHVDQMASATAYIRQPNRGRRLYIANNSDANSLDEIVRDSYELTPIECHVAFFDGQVLPHFVDGIPFGSEGLGVSVNMSMDDGTEPEGLVDYGYFEK